MSRDVEFHEFEIPFASNMVEDVSDGLHPFANPSLLDDMESILTDNGASLGTSDHASTALPTTTTITTSNLPDCTPTPSCDDVPTASTFDIDVHATAPASLLPQHTNTLPVPTDSPFSSSIVDSSADMASSPKLGHGHRPKLPPYDLKITLHTQSLSPVLSVHHHLLAPQVLLIL